MPLEPFSQVAQWRDLFQAVDHAEQWFARWQKQGQIWPDEAEAIRQQYAERRRKWKELQGGNQPAPRDVGLPAGKAGEGTAVQTLRYWDFLKYEIRRLGANRLLKLAETHALLTEARERQVAVAAQLPPADIATAVPAEPADDEAEAITVFPAPMQKDLVDDQLGSQPQPAGRRRHAAEILLDPRNAQWLLAFGGALMVVGLVILLYVNEYFTPPTVAIGLGILNAALLYAGWHLLRATKFTIAGQGMTLLACLVMPLNLWYYHANNLITVGGHLWLPAVIITALYAASAWVLRNELFVYVFVGGLTLTGMLFLADLPPSPERFWEIAAPATFLVLLGLACIHAERAFPDQPGPLGRKRFGLAFFFSGHALLGAGLLLVMGAQLCGHWLYDPIFMHFYQELHGQPSPIVGNLRWLALLLVAVGTYAYVYSDLVVRRLGVYVYISAFTLCWLLVLTLEFLDIGFGIDVAIVVLALAGLLFNVLHATVFKGNPATRMLPYLGVLLPLVAMLLALVVYIQAISPDLRSVWRLAPPNWTFVAGMVLTAISCRVGAYIYRHSHQQLAVIYYFATAAASMIGATALLAVLGLETWQQHAPLVILVPIAYLVAAHFYKGHSPERPMLWVANAALGLMLFTSIATAFDGFTQFVQVRPLNLTLALFFAEAALFYGLAMAFFRQSAAVHCCTAMTCGVVWQLLTYLGVNPEYYALAFAVLGLALLISYRFAVLEGITQGRYAQEAFQSANTLLVVSFAVTFAIAIGRLALKQENWGFIGLCASMTLAGIAAVVLVRQAEWRRGYVVLTLVQVGLTFLAMTVLSELTTPQKIEIACIAGGLAVLIASHIGWYRERDRQDDLVTLGLLLGSLLVGIPLAWATTVDRYHDHFLVLNELGFLAVGVLLLATGILCQLKATTITGALLTGLYFVTLLIFIPWSRLNTVAWFILVAGSLVFSTGLALSVFRDRFATLPARLQRREGVWGVLKWR